MASSGANDLPSGQEPTVPPAPSATEEAPETSPPAEPTSVEPPPDDSSSPSPPPPPSTSSSSSTPPESTSTPPSTLTTSTSQPPSSTTVPTSTVEETTEQTTEIITSTQAGSTETSLVVITTTRDQPQDTTSTGPTVDPTPIDPDDGSGGGGLTSGAKIAIGVAVPIGAIAILAIVALFFWKKHKAKREAEEERRKEVEDYSYNPNADPTIPNVGMGAGDGGYEMREDSSGYRGWGTTTVAGSTGRKASTTMSGGGLAYSDATSPTQANAAVAKPDEPYSPEGEILGAMGPAAANNRGTGVNRGPSNASSSYSAANRSDNSEGGASYGNSGAFYDQQAHNPYVDGAGAQELSGQPVIRDNPARRNTRIENPSHYPQQSAGISQNF